MEDGWRADRGYGHRPRRARDGRARRLSLTFLLGEIGDILASPDHVWFARRVLLWERTLQARTKSEPVVRSRPGRCPRCKMVHVLATRDDGYTECRECHRLLSEGEYQRDVLGHADDGVVRESRAERAAS
jgi:phage FluMu protein Com